MSRIHTEYLDAHHYDRLTAGDVRFREEPDEAEDEEEDEEEEEEEEEEEDDNKDEGYSEEGDEDDQNGSYSVRACSH